MDKSLFALETTRVYIRRDAHRTPLQPVYEGPFKVLKKFAKYFVVDLRRHVDNVSIDRLKSAALSFQNLNSSHPVAENESELLEPISGAVDVDNCVGEVDSIEAGSADDFSQNDCQLPLGTHADPTPGVSSRGRPLRRPNRQSRSSRPPNPPIGGGPHCQKGPQIVLKDPKLHQFKNKVLLGEWDFLRSDSIYFSFKLIAIVYFQIAS